MKLQVLTNMKRQRKTKFYWIKNHEFPTFGKMKEYAFFHMKNGESINAEEINEDGEICKKYLIIRTERRVIIKTVKDYEKEQIEYQKRLQLQLWSESVTKKPISI